MKKILLFSVVVVLCIGCNKDVSSQKFNVLDYDSVTVKDGADNPVRLNIEFLLDSTANDIIKSEEELNSFFSRIVWNLQLECNYPRTFIPTKISTLKFLDTIEYKGDKIYVLESLVHGVASNAYGVEGDVADILDLIAWRSVTYSKADEQGHVEELFALWSIMKNDRYYLKEFKERIDDQKSKESSL